MQQKKPLLILTLNILFLAGCAIPAVLSNAASSKAASSSAAASFAAKSPSPRKSSTAASPSFSSEELDNRVDVF